MTENLKPEKHFTRGPLELKFEYLAVNIPAIKIRDKSGFSVDINRPVKELLANGTLFINAETLLNTLIEANTFIVQMWANLDESTTDEFREDILAFQKKTETVVSIATKLPEGL